MIKEYSPIKKKTWNKKLSFPFAVAKCAHMFMYKLN